MITKRLLDILLLLFLSVVLIPLFLITYVSIVLIDGSPVFFKQQRLGLNGEIFEIIKFRTMTQIQNDDKFSPDSQRTTKLGRFLRSTSLDELPNLCLIYKGKMSFVGPRPLLVKYKERYSPIQMRRHEVLPGLTGWAQVNGRNNTSWEQRFNLDVWYVDNRNILLDIKILFNTVFVVLSRKNVNQDDDVTMPEFLGNKDTTRYKDKV
jgi:sugar transferase EpsL